MRGKEEMLRRNYAFEGITPAYAGKSESGSRWFKMKRDHPRLCGEKMPLESILTRFKGSPPPMRGKACDKRKFRSGIRITPAYAGKSPRR